MEEARRADGSRMNSGVIFMSDLMRVTGSNGTDEDLLADNYLVTQVCSATAVTRYARFSLSMEVTLQYLFFVFVS